MILSFCQTQTHHVLRSNLTNQSNLTRDSSSSKLTLSINCKDVHAITCLSSIHKLHLSTFNSSTQSHIQRSLLMIGKDSRLDIHNSNHIQNHIERISRLICELVTNTSSRRNALHTIQSRMNCHLISLQIHFIHNSERVRILEG